MVIYCNYCDKLLIRLFFWYRFISLGLHLIDYCHLISVEIRGESSNGTNELGYQIQSYVLVHGPPIKTSYLIGTQKPIGFKKKMYQWGELVNSSTYVVGFQCRFSVIWVISVIYRLMLGKRKFGR